MTPYRRIVHATDFSSSALPALRQAEGLPVDEVLRCVRRQRADFLVLGTHGRTGLRRALMGSMVERVVSQARCPVLTVRQ